MTDNPTTEELEIRGMALQAMMQVEELKAKQTRWVKCSERLPVPSGGPSGGITEDEVYLCATEGTINGKLLYGVIIAGVSNEILLPVDYPMASNWKIVAWLENIPEYIP